MKKMRFAEVQFRAKPGAGQLIGLKIHRRDTEITEQQADEPWELKLGKSHRKPGNRERKINL